MRGKPLLSTGDAAGRRMPRLDETRLIGPRGGDGGVGRPCSAVRDSVASGLRVVSKCPSQVGARGTPAPSVHNVAPTVRGGSNDIRTSVRPATIGDRCRDRL